MVDRKVVDKGILATLIGSLLFAGVVGGIAIMDESVPTSKRGDGPQAIKINPNGVIEKQSLTVVAGFDQYLERKDDGTERVYPASDQVVIGFNMGGLGHKPVEGPLLDAVMAIRSNPLIDNPDFWSKTEGALSVIAGYPIKFQKVIAPGIFSFKFNQVVSTVEPAHVVLAQRKTLVSSIAYNLSNNAAIEKAEEDILVFPVRDERAVRFSVEEERALTEAEVQADAEGKAKKVKAQDYEPGTNVPVDQYYSRQWYLKAPSQEAGLSAINGEAVWERQRGSDSVVIAVVDTGYVDHPDLTEKLVPGIDLISDPVISNDGDGIDSDPRDPGDWVTAEESLDSNGPYAGCPVSDSSWHGTHVAGIAAASTSNDLGMAGVDWNAKIQPVRVLGKCGGYLSEVATGMMWAAGVPIRDLPENQTPAKVINLSIGAPASYCPYYFRQALKVTMEQGSAVVSAAGNSGSSSAKSVPGNCAGIVNVASVGRDAEIAFYSNRGGNVSLSAPGGDSRADGSDFLIQSIVDMGSRGPEGAGYALYQGTSMAAPQVSGVMALMFAENPGLSAYSASRALLRSVRPFPSTSSCATDPSCGSGLLDANLAVAEASKTYPDLKIRWVIPRTRAFIPSIPSDVRVRIENIGDDAVENGSTDLSLKMRSKDNGVEYLIKSYNIASLNLSPNRMLVYNFPDVIIPETVPPGEYEMIASINSEGGVVETDQSNNVSPGRDIPIAKDEFFIDKKIYLDQAPSLANFRVSHPDRRVSGLLGGADWEFVWDAPESEPIQERGGFKRVSYPGPTDSIVSVTMRHVSGYERQLSADVHLVEAQPFEVSMRNVFNNNQMKTPMAVRVYPRISGGHPQDRVEEFLIKINGVETSTGKSYAEESNRGPVTFNIEKGGTYDVTIQVKSKLGLSSEVHESFSLVDNIPPSCSIERQNDTQRKQIVMYATCSDEDGSVRSYNWSVGGVGKSGRVFRKDYEGSGIMSITFVAKDDSGAEYRSDYEVPY